MQRKNDKFLERLPLLLDRPWLSYTLAIAVSAAALIVRLWVDPYLPQGFPFITFFPAVIVSAFLFGVGPGLAAALVSGTMSYVWFLAPNPHSSSPWSLTVAMAFFSFVVLIDIALIHWMQRANYHLALERERGHALAETRQLLFDELQHRVSNNLQVVGAMLALQRKVISDEPARQAMDDAARRVALIGRISRGLYTAGQTRQPLDQLVRRLASDILEAAGRSDIRVDVDAASSLDLAPDAVVPLALIVAEALNNIIEHGLAERTDGLICISVEPEEQGRVLLAITDNGVGLAEDFEANRQRNLGLRIASTLARQLKGEFHLENAPHGGARASLRFALT